MGTKKRSSDSVEVAESQLDVSVDRVVLNNKPKKKVKKEKGKDKEFFDGQAGKPSAVANSIKPMERRKKRKALDKERRRETSENEESKPEMDIDFQSGKTEMPFLTSKSSLGLPEFHIGKMDIDFQSGKTEVPSLTSKSSLGLPEFHIGVFKDLASADASARIVAAERLAVELQEVQKAYDILDNKDTVEGGLKLEAEKDDGLNGCAPSLRYAVRRLIRGVSSSRECARQGFALGLTILLGNISSIKLDSLLKLINDLLEVTSSMRGQEARDCLLGRLFAYGALARSGRLSEEWASDRNTPLIKKFVSLLISLAKKKRYLQEPVVSVILDLIEKLPEEAVLHHLLEAPGLHEWFDEATEVGNPDALLLALKIHEKIVVECAVFGKLLPNPFSPNKLFAADNLLSLASCLKESSFCQPRVHSVWSVLVNMLLPDILLQAEDVVSISSSLKKHKKNRKGSSSEEEIAKNFHNFIEIIIEGSLLWSSHDRKHLAFDILLILLPKLPASFVPIFMSYKIVQCLMDVLSTKDSWLFKVAQHFLKELSNWVKQDDAKRVAVIVALQKHSSGKFDCLTRTKTVKDLMTEFSTESGCMLFIQNLQNMFVDESHASEEPSDQSQTTDDNSEMGSIEDKEAVGTMGNSDILKTWIIESLPSLLKYLKLDPEAKIRFQKEILKFLAVQGLFTASLGTEVTSFELQEKFRWPKVATSSDLCRICIEQLQLLLANAQKVEGSRALLNGTEPNDLGSYFMRFLSTLHNIPSISLFRALEDEEENVLKKLQAIEASLLRQERNHGIGTNANKMHALRYLLIQLLLQVLLQPREFSEAASELIICCTKVFPAPDLLDNSVEEDMDGDTMPEVMDVLVDTLLSLLPQSTAPLRTAIEQVFKYFCDDITDDGLLRMLRVIKKSLKPTRRKMADSENDESEEDDDDFLDIEEDEIIDKADTGETGENDEQTDDSEMVGGVELVDKAVPEGSDDSDGGMDDDAMFRMDTYLAQIFKEKKNQAGSESAHFQLELFKLRVLSLLEIYLHENPCKSQVLLVYSKLAQALLNAHTAESSEQLVQRIWGILQKKIFKAKDYPKGEYVQLSNLESLLQKNLKLSSKPIKKKKPANSLSKKQSASLNRQKMIASLAQDSTFWILKIIDARNFEQSDLQQVYDIFQDILVGYFDSKKSQIKSEFLKEIFRRRPWIGRHLIGLIINKCADTKSEFRRVEALDLVFEILRSSDGSSHDEVKKILKSHLSNLCRLIQVLVTNKPEKQSRRAEVRKFCGKIFNYIIVTNLAKSFLKSLEPKVHEMCESQFGDQFNNLKKLL